MAQDIEYPLSEMPRDRRRRFFPVMLVLFSFTFFTGTMFAGGRLGAAFDLKTLLGLALAGNLLLAGYAALLGQIAARSGLNTVLMGRFCFGRVGSRLSDFVLGFAELGWYAWGTATIALSLVQLIPLPASLGLPLMVVFGIAFCLTALVGFKGLDLLSRIAIPVMLILLVVAMWRAAHHAGGLQAMAHIAPSQSMGMSTALTIIFGTFASGATQATNWTRQANSSRTAVWASIISFLLGNGLMVVAGGWCALVYQQADIVQVMILQGLAVAAVVMLVLNLTSIQGPTIYNVSAAACHFFRVSNRRLMTLLAAAAGILLALAGMSDWLIPFLEILGTIIPPIGGVILADYWRVYQGQYPAIESTALPAFNLAGLIAYAIGTLGAFLSPWLAPLVGILLAALAYVVLSSVMRKKPSPIEH